MRNDFYAYLDRMKYIKRWPLMRSVREENVMEHTQSVTQIAHALVVLHNDVFGGHADVLKTVLYALYHETGEVMTGDLPTPIKYYNRNIHGAYKEIEKKACEKIVNTLPEEMKGGIAPYVLAEEDCIEYQLVTAPGAVQRQFAAGSMPGLQGLWPSHYLRLQQGDFAG